LLINKKRLYTKLCIWNEMICYSRELHILILIFSDLTRLLNALGNLTRNRMNYIYCITLRNIIQKFWIISFKWFRFWDFLFFAVIFISPLTTYLNSENWQSIDWNSIIFSKLVFSWLESIWHCTIFMKYKLILAKISIHSSLNENSRWIF